MGCLLFFTQTSEFTVLPTTFGLVDHEAAPRLPVGSTGGWGLGLFVFFRKVGNSCPESEFLCHSRYVGNTTALTKLLGFGMPKTKKGSYQRKSAPRPKKKAKGKGAFSAQARNIGAIGPPRNAPELKNFDTILTVGAYAQNWSTFQHLNAIPQGATANQRIGRKLTLKKLAFRWNFRLGTGSSLAPLRMIIVYDHSPLGSVPLATDVLNSNDINGQFNLNNSERFMILADRYLVQEQGYEPSLSGSDLSGAGWAGKLVLNFNPGLNQQYNGNTGGGIADVTSGAIYVSFCSTVSGTALLGTVTTFNSRVRYTDV